MDGTDAFEHVLELRIHGVNNTSPAAMLDLPPDAVERRLGDGLAGFWRERPGAQARLRPGDRGWRPAALTREAYSWGGLARNTPDVPGGGWFATAGRALSRVGWTLVLPFGVANVAYWTRRLGPSEASGSTPPGGGAGAGGARIFGLGLTALATTTACEVSMDLIAVQCYDGATKRCDRLPGAFDVLADHDVPVRLVLAAVAPIALLALLFWLSSVTRSRYERATHAVTARPGAQADPRPTSGALLARPGFWSGFAMLARLAKLHLAVGLAVVTLALAWPALFARGSACRDDLGSIDVGTCWQQAFSGDGGLPYALAACVLGSWAVLVGAAAIACRTARDAPDFLPRRDPPEGQGPGTRDPASWLLGLAAAALAGTGLLLLAAQPEIAEGKALLGVNVAPTATLAVLVAMVGGSLGWRHGGPGRHVLVLALVAGFAVAVGRLAAGGPLLAVLVLGAVWWFLLRRTERDPRRWVAWFGAGPAVFLSLALVLSVTLSALVTLVTGNWLNGKNGVAALLAGAAGNGTDPDLRVPTPYVLFGVGALLAVVGTVVVVAVMLARTAGGSIRCADGGPDAGPGSLSDRMRERVAGARCFAARLHRAERILGVLAAGGMAVVVTAVALSAASWPGPGDLDQPGWETGLRRIIEAGAFVLAGGGLVLFGVLVGGGKGRTRPLGLIWDLVGFLPRAAHPFAPPCYAERAVPELVERVAWWLAPADGPGKEPADDRRRGERVVLSAHSLGSVLAVAAVLALPRGVTERAGRPVRLLTYGTQLRPYFGRIFPELLGPAVLGTREIGPPRFWARRDPWEGAELPAGPAVDPAPGALLELMGGPAAWRSLWRRTDYLGFPLWSYAPNAFDVPAEEVDRTGYLIDVVTHSNYPRAAEYGQTLTTLAAWRPGEQTAGPGS